MYWCTHDTSVAFFVAKSSSQVLAKSHTPAWKRRLQVSGCSREDKLRKYIVCNVLKANAMLLEKSSAHHSWNTYDARSGQATHIFFWIWSPRHRRSERFSRGGLTVKLLHQWTYSITFPGDWAHGVWIRVCRTHYRLQMCCRDDDIHNT